MSTALDLSSRHSLGDRVSFYNIVTLYRFYASRSEYGVLDELISLVCHNPNCFERRKEEGAKHIAASVFLMRPEDQRALFMQHRLIGRWTQPGGHSDGDPDIHRVALSELKEEVGITCDELINPIPFEIRRFDYPPEVFGYAKSIFNLFFMAWLPNGQQPKIMEPKKCGELRWADPDEAEEMVRSVPHDGYVRLIEKWRVHLSRLGDRL